jgi:antitoxin FitA
MSLTCDTVRNMSKMIQIRNVPDDLHRRLKIRAAEQGVSLSDYLLRMAEREAGRPTIEELSERIRRRGRVRLSVPTADIIRELRDETG